MREESDSLRCLIEKALPRRRLAVKRDALADQLLERVRLWREITRHAENNAASGEQLRIIANALLPPLKKAAKQLRKIGAHRSKEDALQDPTLSISEFETLLGEVGPFSSQDWLLNLGVNNALDVVNRFAGPRRAGRPAQHGAMLTLELNAVLVRAGCGEIERDYLIATLSGHCGLPPLDLHAAIEIDRKRDQRGTRGAPLEMEYQKSCISARAKEKAAARSR